MKTEVIISPILDEKIQNDIENSPIWKECYRVEETLTDEFKQAHPVLYMYEIKFDGLKPVQLTKMDAI